WIAPDVPQSTVNEYLEKYRIRVITYDNRDNSHRNLVRLIETLTDFAPPRLSVHISQSVARAATSPLEANAAAPGFFVFTKLSEQTDFETKQTDAMVAAIRAVLQKLQTLPRFSIQQALEMAGWPPAPPVRPELAARIADRAVGENLLSRSGNLFVVSAGAENAVKADRSAFQHLRNRFHLSVQNRLHRTFPTLTATQAAQLATDIDASLTGYFREGGLTLASSLTAQPTTSTVPTSVIRFINDASAKYDQHLLRQAFSTASLECFIKSDPAEREYLGRVSQGFFAFHLLGVFGDAAMERLRHAKDTIWLVDSSAQIAAIAAASAANAAFSQAFQRLSDFGIRLFTTDRLFDETREHLWFANKVINTGGPDSPNVIAAARGDVPYRKANLFLEGFINWRAAGNPADWDQYLTQISGQANVTAEAVRDALRRVGIESVAHSDWPGFTLEDHAEVMTLTEEIVGTYSRGTPSEAESEDLQKKAKPEAEAFIIIFNERNGKYHMLTDSGHPSPAWFLSQTAILNALRPGPKITWQPEAFFRFAATLAPASDQNTANRAFETLLWGLAQSGVTVLDDRVASAVFGGIIDQAKLSIVQQHAAYEQSLSRKYGEPIESVLERVPRLQQPLAALQLANERAETESSLKAVAQAVAKEAVKRAETAETELSEVQRFRRKLQDKQDQAAKRKRKAHSGRKKKR
ncbi:MAG: hypothetical protein WA672_07045, partial [Candidatus Angelobacter sp.]